MVFIETYIGNMFGNKYNYFLGDETKIRLSKLNEYRGYRVCPLINENNVYLVCPLINENNVYLETVYGGVRITDLIEWYINEYNVLH